MLTKLPVQPKPNTNSAGAITRSSRPRPRPRSASSARLIQVQNRRRRYVELHTKYLHNSEHELSNPILYDSLVRRHLSPAQREADGKAKGYARTLEGHFVRSEAKLASLCDAKDPSIDTDTESDVKMNTPDVGSCSHPQSKFWSTTQWSLDHDVDIFSNPTRQQPYAPGTNAASFQTQALQLWHVFLLDRFVAGYDVDFNYTLVDDDETLDELVQRDAEEAWFDDEEPSAVNSREGDTGIQDF
ncbi:hypothetical protein CFIMG_006461RAa [Ceratocystis fimbriata CBS 114723]|uniref:CCD97-like C-terminal domain-containing protein n=1 Tax=Ceratocystis fimbriata CBS 114723 TaxID=1035309 RepID=A0A2C5WWN1_9PEZI|nr:hypothetical protein CFIMG_006461RAa [Ceratocystis fimbriata CBS 114723]